MRAMIQQHDPSCFKAALIDEERLQTCSQIQVEHLQGLSVIWRKLVQGWGRGYHEALNGLLLATCSTPHVLPPMLLLLHVET